MSRQFLIQPKVIIAILFLQIIPFVMLPLKSFSFSTQEWWLPALLGFLALIGIFQLVVRRSFDLWPWYLISFAQGFNIISRLMMLMPHATENRGGVIVMDWSYLILTVLSMTFSVLLLWYTEWPEVRLGLLKD